MNCKLHVSDIHPLIHDWNDEAARGAPGRDAERRDAARRPAVAVGADAGHRREARSPASAWTPSGSTPPTSGCRAPVRTSPPTSNGWRASIGDGRLRITANCAARTLVADIQPIADIVQRTGVPIECCAFIGSSPIRQYAEGWTLDFLQRTHRGRDRLRGQAGADGDVRHRRHDPRRSRSLRALFTTALRAGASRLCIADTVGHATPAGAAAVVRFVKGLLGELGSDAGIDWHGHRDRGFGVACALAALEAGATRLHGTALGIGERCGNTPIDLLLVNLVMMGYVDRDLSPLPAYCEAVSRACDVPIPRQLSGGRRRRLPHGDRRPRRRGREGVPQERSRADGRGLRGGARQPRRPGAADRGRTDVGQVERRLLAGEPRAFRRPTTSSTASSPPPRRRSRTLTAEQIQTHPRRLAPLVTCRYFR